MSNSFYFDDDSSSSLDLDSLPYPKPLTRAAFLTPEFDPTDFLSSLHNRFQTLEDLREELRQRSQDLNKELLDLVNSNYEDFLGLGRNLKGGDEKVEEVRLGLLGFKREVEVLRGKVRERREMVERLMERKRGVREEIVRGRGLLEVERRVVELEERLMLVPNGGRDGDAEDGESEGSDDEENEGVGVGKLRRHAEQYIYITRLVQKLGPEHPFLVGLKERIQKLRQTVLLDLDGALKQIGGQKAGNAAGVLQILNVYQTMNESRVAVMTLKEAKSDKQ